MWVCGAGVGGGIWGLFLQAAHTVQSQLLGPKAMRTGDRGGPVWLLWWIT